MRHFARTPATRVDSTVKDTVDRCKKDLLDSSNTCDGGPFVFVVCLICVSWPPMLVCTADARRRTGGGTFGSTIAQPVGAPLGATRVRRRHNWKHNSGHS